MRRFAWLLVILGVIAGIVTPIWVERDYQVQWAAYRALQSERCGPDKTCQAYFALSHLPLIQRMSMIPGFVAGACLAGFGVLLLAIRPPR